MVVVAPCGGAGVVGEVFVRLKVFEGDFVAMGAVVSRDGDPHCLGDFFIMLTMTGDAAHGVDMLEEDSILRILEFANWVRIAKGLEVFTVAIVTSGARDTRSGEEIFARFIGMTFGASQLNLVVTVSGFSGENERFVIGLEKDVREISSQDESEEEPE